MILLVDNYDSFTYNLAHLIQQHSDFEMKIIRNDELSLAEIKKIKIDAIVISPGPGNPLYPRDFGINNELIKYYSGKLPILGICLGHQGIGAIFGATIKLADKIVHGKTSMISHNIDGIFSNCKEPLLGMRYHSLVIDDLEKSKLLVLARTENNEIMAVKHCNHHTYGLQFHPESFLTEDGDIIINNFLKLCNN